ncbi:Knottin scorpion toxin-like superfamily [Arabidopsis thaliana x Arabidopsis arenosa]|uniref:Defensin-like protein 7 n=4 Tax=Arabidopsis TaxID=3701 RepID=DEF07_ARATH|nr:RecName: Full=Defensin-like protein 7; AltName: Full=Low-molecular-weight cysteine-rich protein 75; Short=Protein LCR75; AltName: Full=Low-molecular-weight cysteine-rich protein 79; Short=Protein LCR79; Flags: Precursor [Arabidopsis thaliana]KAG7638158.1 Knottin scorpion toxin-like superfamily [Arabidopsis thaliana x Arabidopsis arenosa]KAG7642779.1 Knottin scorpion toxin-like superfamily [Arabidopsis suecica]OAP07122.1 LCR79 [Arabidopsis thaliana]
MKSSTTSMQLIPTLFFLTILLASPEMVEGQQMCEAKSLDWKGMCLKWRNCRQVCISEGFTDGRCKGFTRKCICSKPCFVLPN